MTGKRDNILAVIFATNDSTENYIEVIEWRFSNTPSVEIRTSKTELLRQGITGFNFINEGVGKNYRLLKIFYVPSEYPGNWIYTFLIRTLINKII